MKAFYWFGVAVDPSGHVKLRQVHVQYEDGGYVVTSWSKGIAGSLWHVRWVGAFSYFDLALECARREMREWCAGYATVDEGEPPRFERAEAEHAPAGAADPDWWAAVLGVSPDADMADVKAAYRRRATETHPDSPTAKANGTASADAFIQVHAAWEYVKANRP